MADDSPRSVFGGNERIPPSSFYGYLFSGIAVDILAFWLPGAGDIYIAFCRGMYWLNGYKTDKMAMATWVNAAIEAVPLFNALPSATAFAVWTYAINVAETSEAGSVVAGGTLAVNAKKEFEAAGRKNIQDQKTNGGQSMHTETPGEEKTPGSSGGKAPLSNDVTSMNTASKMGGYATSARNTMRGNDRGVDGVKRPGAFPRTFRPDGAAMPSLPRQAAEKTTGPEQTGSADSDITSQDETGGKRDYRNIEQ